MSKEVTLEDYIASFNTCIAELQWAINHPGTVKAFKQGMSVWLLRKIYGQTPYPAENDLVAWQDAARREMSRALLIKQEAGSSYGKGTVRENRMRSEKPGKSRFNGGRKQERDPDAMDVDVAETNRAESKPGTFKRLTPEEKKRLQAEGRCFRCKKQGHLSRDCPDKSKRMPGRSVIPAKRKLRATETTNESEEDSGSATEEADDIKSQASRTSKVSTTMSRISHLTTNEKQEVFDRFLSQGF